MRLTKKVREQLLEQNEGFVTTTHYSAKNFTEDRRYEISGGEVRIRSTGKTSWADSRFSEEYVADEEQTKRFLRNNLEASDTDGVE